MLRVAGLGACPRGASTAQHCSTPLPAAGPSSSCSSRHQADFAIHGPHMPRDTRCDAAARSLGECSTSAASRCKQYDARSHRRQRHGHAYGGSSPMIESVSSSARSRLPNTRITCLSAPSTSPSTFTASEPSLVDDEHPTESGFLTDDAIKTLYHHRHHDSFFSRGSQPATSQSAASASASAASAAAALPPASGFSYPPAQRNQIRATWDALMRWSRRFHTRRDRKRNPLASTSKVVVFGGGSFGTAMGAILARRKPELEVVLLLRDPVLCKDINTSHCNTKYLKVSALYFSPARCAVGPPLLAPL